VIGNSSTQYEEHKDGAIKKVVVVVVVVVVMKTQIILR
jgi:hypothetical protein